jgi:Zn-dependent peptidase ImmA (M78 family)
VAGQKTPVTGAVVEWAISDAGFSKSQVAAKLGVETGLVDAWIREDQQPNKGQFTKLTKLLARPPSFFFLPEPPAESSRAVAFRTYATTEQQPPSDTLEAIRLAERVQQVAMWIQERADADIVSVPSATPKADPESVAESLRAWLGWSVAEQTGPESTDSKAAKALRNAIQAKGIIALNITLDENVTRGFSLQDELAPLVAVNTREHVRARLFSYAHELAHLSLQQDSVCLDRRNVGVERFCNRVAGALLLPKSAFVQYVSKQLGGRVLTEENAKTVRNHFRVSLAAAAIRAEHLGLAETGFYASIVNGEGKKGGGRPVPGQERTRARIRVDQYGHRFVNSILDAEEAGLLRRPQVLGLLRVSGSELADVREMANVGADG